MTLPANDSPLWPIMRVLARQIVLLGALACFYNKMDARDLNTMLLMLFADGAITAATFKAKDKT